MARSGVPSDGRGGKRLRVIVGMDREYLKERRWLLIFFLKRKLMERGFGFLGF